MLRYGTAALGITLMTAACTDMGPHAIAASLVGGALLGISPSVHNLTSTRPQLASM